jgi:SAM-dependent methyltransferase
VTALDAEGDRFEVGEAVARRHALPLRFARARMEALDAFEHASFDVAVVNNSLCYVTSPALRRRALREILRVLRPGGWVVLRNPNRLTPVDPFTALPLVALLPAERAAQVAARLGRPRSSVLLTTPRQARAELRAAGFERVGSIAPRRLGPLGRVARYHHAVARRPLS